MWLNVVAHTEIKFYMIQNCIFFESLSLHLVFKVSIIGEFNI